MENKKIIFIVKNTYKKNSSIDWYKPAYWTYDSLEEAKKQFNLCGHTSKKVQLIQGFVIQEKKGRLVNLKKQI